MAACKTSAYCDIIKFTRRMLDPKGDFMMKKRAIAMLLCAAMLLCTAALAQEFI